MASASDGNQEPGEGNERDEKEPASDLEDEKKIADETEEIFRNFVYHRLTSQIEKEASEGDMSVANIPRRVLLELRERGRTGEFESSQQDQDKCKELGKALAEVGDQIQFKYGDTFQEMISQLGLTPSTAYESFASIARRLFNNGINWGRIVALLCFGYEIAMTVIRRGVEGVGTFVRKIVQYVVRFILRERIARWIADNGGWVSS